MARPECAGLYFDLCKKFWIYNSILLCDTFFIDHRYIVEVVDVYGQKVTPESYAQFYRDSYNGQYRFHVIGVKD